jgi:hypothetical protein
MDDTQQPKQYTSHSASPATPQPVAETPSVPQIVHPQSITGHHGKESEPVHITPSEALPLHPEVEQAGVEVTKEAPQLTAEDHAAGLSLAKESTPVSTQPSGAVQLPDGPMSQDQAQQIVKNGNVSDSKTWFATIIYKLSLGLIKK